MPFERLRGQVQTFRFRLMLWNAFAVILTGLVILVCVREGVRRTLVHDLDQLLSEDLEEIALSFQEESGVNWPILREEMDRKARGHRLHSWFVEFYDARGKVTWSSPGTPPIPELSKLAREGATISGFRVLSQELPGLDSQASSVCVGSSKKLIQGDMSRIDQLVLVVFCGVLLIAPLGGYLLAGRVTRPLSKMIQTTEGLRPAQLMDRLEIRGTGDELDSLAKTVNRLLDRIGDYLQQKHDFLANAAHELRTPLAAIRSSVEVALAGDRSTQEYQELLADVIEECNSLETLVNQLLLLAETDADRHKIHTERVALGKLLFSAVEMFRGVAEFKGVKLSVLPFPAVEVAGNRHHLRQVVNNLLDNAIKFTSARFAGDDRASHNASGDARGEITVELVRDLARNEARIRIRDNGIGIGGEDLARIFERFYRVDRSRSRAGTGGSGLGLSICHAIVLSHQGTIDVESTPGMGTTFTIVLPLAPETSDALARV